MKPPVPGTESREWSDSGLLFDLSTVGPLAAYVLGAGAVVGALVSLNTVGVSPLTNRVASLVIASVPLWTFPVATWAVGAELAVSRPVASRLGVAETWAVLAAVVTAAAVVYGPVVGIGHGPILAAQAGLGLCSYLIAPLWLGNRFLERDAESDVAALTMVLSVAVAFVGGGFLLSLVATTVATAGVLATIGALVAVAAAAATR